MKSQPKKIKQKYFIVAVNDRFGTYNNDDRFDNCGMYYDTMKQVWDAVDLIVSDDVSYWEGFTFQLAAINVSQKIVVKVSNEITFETVKGE